jgi:tetratricopeptide (TPR) repeat protein
MVAPSVLADAPEALLALATDLLVSGDAARGGEYLDLLECAQPSIPPDSRLAARLAVMRSLHYALTGQAEQALAEGLAARAIGKRAQLADDWVAAVPMILTHVYTRLEDFPAVEREAAAALVMPELSKPVKLVNVRGAQALAWFEAGHLADAADAASAADTEARRRGFGQHFFAIEHLRALAGLALERRDLDTAEQLTEQALSISEGGRAVFEFLALLDRAGIWAARGHVREALASVEAARQVLAGTGSVLLARADELEALLRLSTPRRALVRQRLLAGAAIVRRDPMTAGILAGALGNSPPRGLPPHRRHDRTAGDQLPDRALHTAAAGPVQAASGTWPGRSAGARGPGCGYCLARGVAAGRHSHQWLHRLAPGCPLSPRAIGFDRFCNIGIPRARTPRAAAVWPGQAPTFQQTRFSGCRVLHRLGQHRYPPRRAGQEPGPLRRPGYPWPEAAARYPPDSSGGIADDAG